MSPIECLSHASVFGIIAKHYGVTAMPFFQADITFRLETTGALAPQPWRTDVVLGGPSPLGYAGRRVATVWAEDEAAASSKVGTLDFVLDGPAVGKASYSVESSTMAEVDPVEIVYFDRDPAADEDEDPDNDDRADGWYFRYATDSEDSWSGAYPSETDAYLEAKQQNWEDMENSLDSRDEAHRAAVSAVARIAKLLGTETDSHAAGAYLAENSQLRSLHVFLGQALDTRLVCDRRYETCSRLSAEIDARGNPGIAQTSGLSR